MKTSLPILLLLTSFVFLFGHTDAQSLECGTISDPEYEYYRAAFEPPDCDLSNHSIKCVKLKFHYINNTQSTSTSPSDEDFYRLIQLVNEAYKPSKIRFTLLDECIHRVSLDIQTYSELHEMIWKNGQIDPDPEIEWGEDYINIFGFQEAISNPAPRAVPWGDYVYSIQYTPSRVTTLVHELGHILSLVHTFGNFDAQAGETDPPTESELAKLCKDLGATSGADLLCETEQDMICDTGLDPYAMDLNQDDIIDEDLWAENCRQSTYLLPTVEDGCGDDVTSWDIPVNNYMSYYDTDCFNEFTPCQAGAMHDLLAEKSYLTVNCTNDPYLNECSDIVIDGYTEWTNQEITLCPDQRIIIQNTGNLILNKTTLTPQITSGPNSGCPDLFIGRWDGIYIEGRNTNSPSGELRITNGSQIEQSHNGIQAVSGFTKIEIDGSTFAGNGQILNVFDSWPLSIIPSTESGGEFLGSYGILGGDPFACGYTSSFPPAKVVIKGESNIYVIDEGINAGLKEVQLNLNGSSLIIDNSSIEFISNPNPSANPTSIKQGGGSLSLMNGSVIRNFHRSIEKEFDNISACEPRGLKVIQSNIVNSINAIQNRCNVVNIQESFIEGNITMTGLVYGRIYGNTVEDMSNPRSLTILDPEKSVVLGDNCLGNTTVILDRDNSLTYATCNTWDEFATGVYASENSELPGNWGRSNEPSGNRFTGTSSATLISDLPNIINFESNLAGHQFTYLGNFGGVGTGLAFANCNYSLCPESEVDANMFFSVDSFDFHLGDSLWYAYHTRINEIEDSLAITSGNKHLNLLAEQTELRVLQNELTRNALSDLSDHTIDSIANKWLGRVAPRIDTLSMFSNLWYQEELDSLSDFLETTSGRDASIALSVVNMCQEINENGGDLRTLFEEDIDDMITMLEYSYGDYTNLLRGFLNLEYGINHQWPQIDTSSNRAITKVSTQPFGNNIISQIDLMPNPSNGCITVRKLGNSEEMTNINGMIFSLDGRLVDTFFGETNVELCLNRRLKSGLYFAVIKDDLMRTLGITKIIIR